MSSLSRPMIAFGILLGLLALPLLVRADDLPRAGSSLSPQVVTLVNEGFEGDFPPAGWSANGHWGRSDCEKNQGSYSAWVEGSGSLTCSGLTSIYHANENSRLVYGPFDLSDAVTATLSFDLWLWQASGDAFSWGASLDGSSFAGITATNAFTTLWTSTMLNLADAPGLGDLRGRSSVWIGFTWHTDNFDETFEGAFVDNVRVLKGTTAPPATDTSTPTATSTATATGTALPTETATSSATPSATAAPGAPFLGWLSLEGSDDYAQAVDESELDVGDQAGESITLEAWVSFDDFRNGPLVMKTEAYNLYTLWDNGAHCLGFSVKSGGSTYNTQHCSFSGGLWDSAWHHVAGVFDQSTGKSSVYMDGARLVGPVSTGFSTVNNSSQVLQIGHPSAGVVGRVDEVRLSDSVRYAAASYSRPSAAFTCDAHTRGLWHFDEYDGATVFHDACGAVDNVLTGYNGAHTQGAGSPTPTATRPANQGAFLPVLIKQPPLPTATATPTASPIPATPTASATLSPGNHPPAFPDPVSISSSSENEYNDLGQLIGVVTTISLLTPATDPDGDPLTYAWSATNGSIIEISANGLTARWRRVISWGQPAPGTVTVVASDGRGGTDTHHIVFN